VYVGVEFGFVL